MIFAKTPSEEQQYFSATQKHSMIHRTRGFVQCDHLLAILRRVHENMTGLLFSSPYNVQELQVMDLQIKCQLVTTLLNYVIVNFKAHVCIRSRRRIFKQDFD